jgi:SAM-dependent methyltransferase
MSDDVRYEPGGPSDRELRLLGDVKGKRVLDLGCGGGAAAVAFALQGAVSIAVDPSSQQLAEARQRAADHDARVEWHQGDLADLAFLRADSIDLVFSAAALDTTDDPARVFRQVQRVLKPNAAFVFSLRHPFTAVLGPGDTVARPYPSTDGTGGSSVGRTFTDLHRAGMRVDTIAEPPGPGTTPAVIVWRARKEGV